MNASKHIIIDERKGQSLGTISKTHLEALLILLLYLAPLSAWCIT